jgi:hypothetical protein
MLCFLLCLVLVGSFFYRLTLGEWPGEAEDIANAVLMEEHAMTDSQKAAQEIMDNIGEWDYILASGDCTDKDRDEIREDIRKIIDKNLC